MVTTEERKYKYKWKEHSVVSIWAILSTTVIPVCAVNQQGNTRGPDFQEDATSSPCPVEVHSALPGQVSKRMRLEPFIHLPPFQPALLSACIVPGGYRHGIQAFTENAKSLYGWNLHSSREDEN